MVFRGFSVESIDACLCLWCATHHTYIILCHFLPGGPFPFSSLSNGAVVTSHGEDLEIIVAASVVTIQGKNSKANIVEQDLVVNNGLVHTIDAVLLLGPVPP